MSWGNDGTEMGGIQPRDELRERNPDDLFGVHLQQQSRRSTSSSDEKIAAEFQQQIRTRKGEADKNDRGLAEPRPPLYRPLDPLGIDRIEL